MFYIRCLLFGMLAMISISIARGHPTSKRSGTDLISRRGIDNLLPFPHYDRRAAAASSGSSTGLDAIAVQTKALTPQQVSLLTGKKVGLLDLQDLWAAMGVDKVTDPACVAGVATFKAGTKPTQEQADACTATHTAGDKNEKVIINGLRDDLNSGASDTTLTTGIKTLHTNQCRKLCAQAAGQALKSMVAGGTLTAAESAFNANGENGKCSKQCAALHDDQTKGVADPKGAATGTVTKAIQVNIIGPSPPLKGN